ncbi:FAD/NAD(P)-binding domain-containing protein [Venturia nashicola]|uniref:FAD/NAD(P)-binding domain-containing protein n=1 Tax=Venturia nashicola TaxID=86259 RepID=A0A4Z1P9M8_9PEZI|nr:FAD/NAD(P)-binding domain-containing protein [Venturia nashicola]TLD38070.1 FAD/NAD(P)-binding domain-containing protein [Venturia nashicola]
MSRASSITHSLGWCIALLCLLPGASASSWFGETPGSLGWLWPWVKLAKPPVCIIGAGPSGLTAAYNLQLKGYKTVIFDKQPEIGGKCQAYYDNVFHPLGAAFFSNLTYTETLKVINNVSVSASEFSLAGTARTQFNINVTTGVTTRVVSPTPTFQQLLAAEVPKYTQLWTQQFANISAAGYKKGVPASLTATAEDWFRTNGFVALPIALTNPQALYGYGDIRRVPILYILQYITPDILLGFIGARNVYYTDFHQIFLDWTKKFITNPIHTSANITSIDRSGKYPYITYQKTYHFLMRNDLKEHHKKTAKQRCSSLIMAFPPTTENLDAAGLDYTPAERTLFPKVNVENYYSSAVSLKVPYGNSYIASSSTPGIPPPALGEPVALLVLSNISNISTTWSWGPYREYQSIDTAYTLLKDTLSKVNRDPRDPNATSTVVQDEDVKAFRKWDYFPHFDGPALAEGAYETFNGLQGCNKTFWASGLNGMETVEWAIRGAQDIVTSYF